MDDKKINLINKIKKILSIADSTNNDEERQTAYSKAQELLVKYNIEQEELSKIEGKPIRKVVNYTIKDNVQRTNTIYLDLLGTITGNFRCHIIKSYNDRNHASIHIIGLEEDVEIVKLIFYDSYAYYKLRVKMITDQASKNIGRPINSRLRAIIKNNYAKGFTDGLYAKFEEMKESSIYRDKYEVTLLTPVEVKDYISSEYPDSERKSVNIKIDDALLLMNVYNEGYRDGMDYDHTKKVLEG